MNSVDLLLAASTSVNHRFSRLQTMSEWWHWLVLLVISIAILAYVTVVYRRDSVELRPGLAWLLLFLRVCTFAGILFYFLDLEKRSERKIVKNSRAILLIDTSQSMGLQGSDTISGPAAAGRTRISEVVAEMVDGSLLKQLRTDHDVVAYRFDQGAKPVEIAAFPKTGSATKEDSSSNATDDNALQASRTTALVAAGLFAISILASLFGLLQSRSAAAGGKKKTGEENSWGWLVSAVTLIASLVVLAVATLRSPQANLLVTLGLRSPATAAKTAQDTLAAKQDAQLRLAEPDPVDWPAELTVRGAETRIADVIDYVVTKERGGPVAGLVVFTDGGQNAGQPITAGIVAAQDAGIPVFAVGLGSDKRPQNVRVVDIEAPQRVYPGDGFSLTGLVQAFGMQGRTIKVELLSSADGGDANQAETFQDERRVTLGPDGEVSPVKFDVTPQEPGRKTYKVRVVLPDPDHDERDNEKLATVQIVERKQKVLILAGGPSREYQFLRNMLHRDRDTSVDVYLQSAPIGVSQEANEVLLKFPESADDLFEYDCIVGFDPNWDALTEEQVSLLERWVAEEAGGLYVVAGPVFTPLWSTRRQADERVNTIKALYPVEFFYQGSASLSFGRFGGDKAWPLNFTRDGQSAEFLWLGENSQSSEANWSTFEGVYGYYAVKDPKPGALVYARFSDPDTEIDGELPIYLASHFFGAGRVLFQASGEMWRVRAVNDNFFDQYYTKLIRWASQGRLLRDSRRGVLLVDKERCLLGDQIEVRAMLTDLQRQPLQDEEVAATLLQPDGQRLPLRLRKLKEAVRPGTYTATFATQQEGDYRIELRPPNAAEDDLLVREVRARVPALEVERPERNDALLTELSTKTGGRYFIGLDAAMNRRGSGQSLANVLEPQDQTTYLPGTPDKDFERHLMTWLMGLICGVLSLEWLIRRLSKLA